MHRKIEEIGVRAVSRILWTAADVVTWIGFDFLYQRIGEGMNAAGHGLCDWYASRWDGPADDGLPPGWPTHGTVEVVRLKVLDGMPHFEVTPDEFVRHQEGDGRVRLAPLLDERHPLQSTEAKR